MKKIQSILLSAVATLLLTSCGGEFAGLAGTDMDSEAVVNKIKELAKANVDPAKWKIVEISWSEGSGRDELSNKVSDVTFCMMDKDGDLWQQAFLASTGWEATQLRDLNSFKNRKLSSFDASPALNPDDIDPAKILKIIEDAKALIPQGFKFKSVDRVEMTSYEDYMMKLKLNVVEEGKETVSNAGKTSIVFYELLFYVAKDGTVTLNE